MNWEPSPPRAPDELAEALEIVAARVRHLRPEPEPRDLPKFEGSLQDVARGILKARRHRNAVFAMPLFGEPAWDMLLDLYANGGPNGFSVSSVCIAGMCPPTTGLRHVRELEDRGLLVRTDDPTDRRRAFLRLSAQCCAMLEQVLSGMEQSASALPSSAPRTRPAPSPS